MSSSGLAVVEVIRACRRSNPSAVPNARRLLDRFNLVPVSPELLEFAGSLAAAELRSLDAIHLASALLIGAELTAFVAYDRRLQAAAEAERLPVVAPA
jgi:predicted nucleic acid-binding protein